HLAVHIRFVAERGEHVCSTLGEHYWKVRGVPGRRTRDLGYSSPDRVMSRKRCGYLLFQYVDLGIQRCCYRLVEELPGTALKLNVPRLRPMHPNSTRGIGTTKRPERLIENSSLGAVVEPRTRTLTPLHHLPPTPASPSR